MVKILFFLYLIFKFLAKNIHPAQNSSIYALFVLIYSSLYFIFINPKGFKITQTDLISAIVCTLTSLTYQFGLPMACKYEKRASNIGIIFSMQIVFSFILGRIVLGDEILLLNVLGAILVSGSGILILIDKEGNTKDVKEDEKMVELLEIERAKVDPNEQKA